MSFNKFPHSIRRPASPSHTSAASDQYWAIKNAATGAACRPSFVIDIASAIWNGLAETAATSAMQVLSKATRALPLENRARQNKFGSLENREVPSQKKIAFFRLSATFYQQCCIMKMGVVQSFSQMTRLWMMSSELNFFQVFKATARARALNEV